MFDWIKDIDYSLTLTLNAAQTPFWNSIMLFFSAKLVWIPFYTAIIVAMLSPKMYGIQSLGYKCLEPKKIFVKMALTGLIVTILCFLCTDQICNLFKNGFERLRPGHDPILENMLNLPEGKGGLYGFVSAHAANTFALATITSITFRRKWYTGIIFTWATIVAFSRIYLSKHFMSDVVCGAAVGVIIALLLYLLYRYKVTVIRQNTALYQ